MDILDVLMVTVIIELILIIFLYLCCVWLIFLSKVYAFDEYGFWYHALAAIQKAHSDRPQAGKDQLIVTYETQVRLNGVKSVNFNKLIGLNVNVPRNGYVKALEQVHFYIMRTAENRNGLNLANRDLRLAKYFVRRIIANRMLNQLHHEDNQNEVYDNHEVVLKKWQDIMKILVKIPENSFYDRIKPYYCFLIQRFI